MSASATGGSPSLPPQRPLPRRLHRRHRGLRLLVVLLLVTALVLALATVVLALNIRSAVFSVQDPGAVTTEAAGAAVPGDEPGDEPTGESSGGPLLETEDVTFPTGRGDLPALFVAGRSTTWAVLVHGRGQRPEGTLRMARATVAAGLPTLAISYRNDPGVPEDPTGRHAFGQTEWRDLEAAVAYAQSEGAEGVVLGGLSMGGSIVAAYLESSEREAGLVRGLVLDAPVLDLPAAVDNGVARAELPFGLRVPAALVPPARGVLALLDGVDWDAVDYLDDTSWLQVPALVLHTADDTTVPVASSRELVAREPTLARLVELEGDHGEAYASDPERYLGEVSRFLDEVA